MGAISEDGEEMTAVASLHRQLVAASPIGIAVLAADGSLVEANAAVASLTGVAVDDVSWVTLRQVPARLVGGAAPADADHRLPADPTAAWPACDLTDVRPDQPPRRVQLHPDTGGPVVDTWLLPLADGSVALHLQSVATSTPAPTPTHPAPAALPADDLHDLDELTGLPTATAVERAITDLIPQARGAVLLADLDRFLVLNDTMGSDVGDIVIRCAAASLSTVVPSSALLARSGADEFTVVLPDADEDTARRLGEVMVLAIRNGMMLGGGQAPRVTASIGVTLITPIAGRTAADVLLHVDAAMREARSSGRNRAVVSELRGDPDKELAEHRGWVRRLDDVSVGARAWMQPIVPLARHDDVARFELLVRWEDEDGRTRSPAEFLDIAERSGVLEEIDRFMVRRAAMQALAATTPTLVSVNVAVSTLLSTDFPSWLYRTLRGVPEGSVMIEVTESEALGDPRALASAIGAIKTAGALVAVDDFGSGFATFKHLTALDVDVLKLDGSFVRDMATNPGHQRIVAAMAALTDDLGIPMVAECIEDQATADLLIEMGVAWGQGYHFARPLPLPDLPQGQLSESVIRGVR